MASTVATIAERLGFTPVVPDDIDGSRLLFGYNDDADTLYVHFYDRDRPTVSVDVNEYLYLLVDSRDQQVVGLQIEGYLFYVVRKHPEWLPLADLAGIPADDIAKAREAIDINRRREAAVMPILKELNLLAS